MKIVKLDICVYAVLAMQIKMLCKNTVHYSIGLFGFLPIFLNAINTRMHPFSGKFELSEYIQENQMPDQI